ncbi:MAG: hypothetical protein QXF12_02115 [Candidatus Aenigmatarchaeota archaeon]
MPISYEKISKYRLATTDTISEIRKISSLNNLKEEGADHINVSPLSRLALGRILDPQYPLPVNYPHVGRFRSVLSLWYWVRCKDHNDSPRHLVGRALKALAKELDLVKVNNFNEIIGLATSLKIYQNFRDERVKRAIDELSKLPPDARVISYITLKSGIRTSTSYSGVVVPGAQETISWMRRYYLEGDKSARPSFFKDGDSLFGLKDTLTRFLGPDKVAELERGPSPDPFVGQYDEGEDEVEEDIIDVEEEDTTE